MDRGFTIGVDFGTSNSYLSQSPRDKLQARQITFDTALKGFETAVLYQEGRVFLVGSKASETYGTMTLEERKNYQLKALFKPEIGKNKEVDKIAKDYLQGLLRLNLQYNLDLVKRGERFLFGIPSQAPTTYCRALERIAKEAGFPEIQQLEEPVGALLYHLAVNNLPTSAAQKGVLVVDFGGGTCDFALMEALKVCRSWGNMALGGRLFDDLFYQIFLHQDPEHEEKVLQQDGEFYVHWYLSREAKEKFSQQMMVNRDQAFHYPFPGYGRVRSLTWDSFLEWARNYRPTKQLLQYLTENGVEERRLTSGRPVDLLGWFQEELAAGFPAGQPLGHVVLAGGSSLWPFVMEQVQELTGLQREDIYCADNPYVVVSMGLALYPALLHRNQRAKEQLYHKYPTFVEEEIKGDILTAKITQVGEELSHTFSSLLFQGSIKPLLQEFRMKGGRLDQLQDQLQKAVESFQEEAKGIMVQRMEEELSLIPYLIGKRVVEFFAREGLYYHQEGEISFTSSPFTLKGVALPTKRLLYSLGTITTPMATYIGMEVGASIALIFAASGLPGLITGGLLGLLGGYWGGRKADSFIMKMDLPPLLTRWVIRPKKMQQLMEKGKRSVEEQMQAHFLKETRALEEAFLQEIGPAIHREIDSLSLIASLKPLWTERSSSF